MGAPELLILLLVVPFLFGFLGGILLLVVSRRRAGTRAPENASVPSNNSGWYPDPNGNGNTQLRYWDGSRWTADTRPIASPIGR